MEIYDRVIAGIGAKLAEDGFAAPTHSGLFVKPLGGPWHAWISVPGNSSSLDPMVGTINDEIRDISYRARAMIGKHLERRPDGPPLLMVDLERLAADCPACSTDAPWEYHGQILTLDVVDEFVACLRKYGYPFFEKYASLQATMDASKERMVGFAFPWFAPIVLIKLGRVDDAKTYADNYAHWLPDAEHASQFRAYFNLLLKMLA